MKGEDFFNSMDRLEPKCPGCQNVIDYGITTEWDDEEEAHKCKNCGFVIR